MAPQQPSLVLAAILCVAFLIRVHHYDYNVGRALTYDTENKISQARAVADGELAPKNWKQPYFLPYGSGALLFVAGLFTHVDSSTAERLITLFMIALAVGTVFVTYLIALQVSDSDRRTAELAAALLAVVPIHVVGSRYIKEDMPVVFFTHVALYFMVRALDRGAFRDYVLSGLGVGWAIGSKFSAILLLPVLAGTHVFRVVRARGGVRELFAPRALVAALVIPVGIACFNPYALVQPEEFVRGLAYQIGYSSATHHDGTRVEPWTHWWGFYLKYALFPGLTWIVASSALVGLFRTAQSYKDPKRAGMLVLGASTLLAYFVFEKATAKPFPFFARYIQPIVPALCIFAATALVELARFLRSRLPARVAGTLGFGVVGLALLWPAVSSLLIGAAIDADTRLEAATWINEHLPPGSKLGLDDPRYSPRPNKRRFELTYFGLFSNRLYDRPLDRLRSDGYDYVVLNNFRTDRFRIAKSGSDEAERANAYYVDLRGRATLVREFRPQFSLQTYGFHNPVIAVYSIR